MLRQDTRLNRAKDTR